MSEQSFYELQIDLLAVGLTRPAMFMGVALKALLALVFFCSLLYVYTKTILVIPLFAVLYFFALYFSSKEPRFYEFWLQYFSKTPPLLNYAFWGKTNSYEPW